MIKKEIFRLDINDLKPESYFLARESYKRYGAFIIENSFSISDVLNIREYCKKLFAKSGDKRLRYLKDVKSEEESLAFSNFFANEKLLNTILAVFNNKSLYLLPPYNIAKNYLPHSINTEAMGWHRDCNGELNYKECVSRLKNKEYFFAKIGVYLQTNSSYGGAIDIIPGSNNDYFGEIKLSNLNNFYVASIVFLQRFFKPFYRLKFLRKFLLKLMKSKTLRVRAGDVVIFDSRIMHKGTFADEKIENLLKYDTKLLQADLPDKHTKYVLYSHLGNSLGIESYFIDRLNRNKNSQEIKDWTKDQEKILELNLKKINLIPSLNIFKSLLTNSKKYASNAK